MARQSKGGDGAGLGSRLGTTSGRLTGSPSTPRQPGGFKPGGNRFGTLGNAPGAGNQASGGNASGAGNYPSVQDAVRNKL